MEAEDEESISASSQSYQILLPTIPALSGIKEDLVNNTLHSHSTSRVSVYMCAAGAWREEVDQETGSIFYVNTSTLESRWQRPPDMSTADSSYTGAAAQPPLLAKRDVISSPHQTPSEESMSFVNIVPALMRAKRKWRALVDSASGSTYYVDESTGESQWEIPSPEPDSPRGDCVTAPEDNTKLPSTATTHQQHQEGTSLSRVLPALMQAKRKWRALLDDSTGSTYYVDEATGEAQWERPPEIDVGLGQDDSKVTTTSKRDPSDTVVQEAMADVRGEGVNQPRAASEIGDHNDGGHVYVKAPVILGIDSSENLAREEKEISADGHTQDSDACDTSKSNSNSLLHRVDSNSTLSTYGGELDSLAKYVTGHSSTLDRGAMVEIRTLKEEAARGSNSGHAEEAPQSTDETSSHDVNYPTSGSKSSIDSAATPEVAESSSDTVAESKSRTLSSQIVPRNPSLEECLPAIEKQHALAGEVTADCSVSSSIQSSSQQERVDASIDKVDQLRMASSSPDQDRAGGEDHGVSPIARSDEEGGDAKTISVGADTTEVRNERLQTSQRSEPSPRSDEKAGEEMLGESTPVRLSSNSSETGPSQKVEGRPGDVIADDTTLNDTAKGAPGSLSSFDTVAVTAQTLRRLQEGMLLRRQTIAVLKLQANGRGWVARRSYKRFKGRHETRQREKTEAQQRAATAIQAAFRRHAARRRAQLTKAQKKQDSRHHGDGTKEQRTPGNTIMHSDDREASKTWENEDNSGGQQGMSSTVDVFQSEHLYLADESSMVDTRAGHHKLEGETSLAEGRRKETIGVDGMLTNGDGSDDDAAKMRDSSNDELDVREGGPMTSTGPPTCFEEKQAASPLELSDDGVRAGGFEASPLATIDEEGHQRNGYLWGEGGDEPGGGEKGQFAEASTTNYPGYLTDKGDDTDAPPQRPGWIQVLDNKGGVRVRSDGVSDEELTEEGPGKGGIGSEENAYDTFDWGRGGEEEGDISSELTISNDDDDHKRSLSEDESICSSSRSRFPFEKADATIPHDGPGRESAKTPEGNRRDCRPWRVKYDDESEHDDVISENSEESVGQEICGKGVYVDSAAPLKTLEDLRGLVAAQAQAAARVTMTGAGTDASKQEAIRIRNLAEQQTQAAARFREAIRHSLASRFTGGGDRNRPGIGVPTEPVAGSQTHTDWLVKIAPCVSEERLRAQDASIREGGQGYGKHLDEEDELRGSKLTTNRERNRSLKDGDPEQHGEKLRARRNSANTSSSSQTGGNTTGAAFALAANLSRLASRQDTAANDLLQIPPDARNRARNVPGVLDPLVVLGQSVGLQAKVVGLMEEVVTRTGNSRLDARKAARARRKERVGRLAESMAEDVKLIAARHQHAASRMEGAPNPATARHVADDIRRMTLVQEQAAYQVQQFIASVDAAVFNGTGGAYTKPSIAKVHSRFGNELEATAPDYVAAAQIDASVVDEGQTIAKSESDGEPETAQNRVRRLASAVVQELRKGVDVGTVAAARAQAIRRGSQAGRLADELRHIASGQVAAALALSAVGEKLVAEALAEMPLPREHALPSRDSRRHRDTSGAKYAANPDPGVNPSVGRGGRSKAGPQASVIVRGNRGDGFEAVVIASETDVPAGCAAQEDEGTPARPGLDLLSAAITVNPTAATIAIENAAREEEQAAATRIQAFLRRRRRQGRSCAVEVVPFGEGAAAAPATPAKTAAFAEASNDGNSSISSTVDWFGVALRFLRREVDTFLLGEEMHGGVPERKDLMVADGSPPPPLSCDNIQITESGQRSTAEESDSDGSTGGENNSFENQSVDDPHETNTASSENYEPDWPTLPPVPLRARAPSLYTLPLPGGGLWTKALHRVGDGLEEEAEANSQSPRTDARRGIFTKLDPEVAARLSAATSIFSLRAADVLAAFPPPTVTSSSCPVEPPAGLRNEKLSGTRPSTVPRPAGGTRRGSANLSSPEALRRRLRTEAEDASHAGLGRPWLLCSRKTHPPTRHRLEQQQRSAFVRVEKSARAAHGHVRSLGFKQARECRRRADFFGPWTPLGRRLAKRFNAGRAARRRCIRDETDAFRVRQVGRQLRSGAALNALEQVERALDVRLSLAREERVPPAHVSELLDFVGRFVFSDSRLREEPAETRVESSGGAAQNDSDPERNRCLICQDLLEDLRRKFPVVGDQSSWMDDRDPFCCDRCWQNSPRSESPGEGEPATFSSSMDDQKDGDTSAAAGNFADVSGTSRHPASSGREKEEETPVLPTVDDSNPGIGDGGVGNRGGDPSYGASSSRQSDGQIHAPPVLISTDFPPGVLKEGASTKERIRGVKAMPPEKEAEEVLPTLEALGVEQQIGSPGAQSPITKPEAVAAAFSAHLQGVDKYPLELARLCRFAQFLTENQLHREAYEVILHVVSSFAVVTDDCTSEGRTAPTPSSSPLLPVPPLPSGLRGQLLVAAGRLAIAVGRYPEAVRHVKAAVRTVTNGASIDDSNSAAPSESPKILVSSSRVFEYLLDDRSAEVLLLGCLVQYPDYKPALLSYGQLAGRTGELAVAERYIMRATTVSSRKCTTGKGGQERARGLGVEVGPAEDWVALMKLYPMGWATSARGADEALACFRKALSCLASKNLENQRKTKSPSSCATTAAASVACPSASSTMETPERSTQPSAETLLELGRFELLRNRCVSRAAAFFKACLQASPRHASAKLHLAACMLEELGPLKNGRAPSRANRRIDALLRSILHFPDEDQPAHPGKNLATPLPRRMRPRMRRGRTPSALTPPPEPTPRYPRYYLTKNFDGTPVRAPGQNGPKVFGGTAPGRVSGRTSAFLDVGRGTWLLWTFYAKFAEHCLQDQHLAMCALDKAVASAAMVAPPFGPSSRPSTRSLRPGCASYNQGRMNIAELAVPFSLIARAQFYQRYPTFSKQAVDCAERVGSSREVSASPEETLMDISERFSNNPATHSVLGHFLLSKVGASGINSIDDRETLERAIAIFRNAANASETAGETFVPATRGLIVALRRRRLMVKSAAASKQQTPTTAG
ncbi:unnamed protein product, partial [Scytosiphon promiscuus]